MRVVKIKSENICDMPLCKKTAQYAITSNSGVGKSIYLCDKCKQQLYVELAKLTVPKGIENVIVRANKRREINE